jgi:hypothetical protein
MITDIAKKLAEEEELGFEPEQITSRRIGRVFGRMRLREQPRSGSGGKRQWRLSKGELRRWLISYGISLPPTFFPDGASPPANGANGVHGANGAERATRSGSPESATQEETRPQRGEAQTPSPAALPDGSPAPYEEVF